MSKTRSNGPEDGDAEETDEELVGTRSDMLLAGQAINNGWDISADVKAKLLGRATKIGLKSRSERNALRAIQVVINADKVNLQSQKLALELPPPPETTDPAAIREAMRQLSSTDREAIEDLERERLAAAYPGALRDAREQGAMAAGETPLEDR